MKAISQQMSKDAVEIINEIAGDLFASVPLRVLKSNPLYPELLCERHGGLPLTQRLPKLIGGCCFIPPEDEGRILITDGLTDKQRASVVAHELAHRLCICSERYAHFNRLHMVAYDWREFQELIAIGIEYLYYLLTGFSYRNLSVFD